MFWQWSNNISPRFYNCKSKCKNCKLHGNNCIGNKGNSNETPVIGDNADLGFGSVVIGNVRIANNVTVGANAVVTKSFDEDGSVIVGVPAKRRK